jgi:hypothetical protein
MHIAEPTAWDHNDISCDKYMGSQVAKYGLQDDDK